MFELIFRYQSISQSIRAVIPRYWVFICSSLFSHFCLISWFCISIFLSSRSDYLGADDVWRQAVWWNSHTWDSWPAWERRTSPPAAHLHHWRLHGHGEMYEHLLTSFLSSAVPHHCTVFGISGSFSYVQSH